MGLLHVADAAVRIEHQDSRAFNIVEALQRGLAGVAAGSGEDDDLLIHAQLLLRGGDQPGQHGERHILEGGGGAAVQLQHEIGAHLLHRGQIPGFELVGISGFDQRAHFVACKVVQQPADDLGGYLCGAHVQQAAHVYLQLGKADGRVQAAVGGDALQYGLGGGGGMPVGARAVQNHGGLPSLCVEFFFIITSFGRNCNSRFCPIAHINVKRLKTGASCFDKSRPLCYIVSIIKTRVFARKTQRGCWL